MPPRMKALFKSHKDRKRKPTHAINILDVITGDRRSFSSDHILKTIKNAHESCLLNNELKEGTQASEHLPEKCISILCLPNLSNSSTISATSIRL